MGLTKTEKLLVEAITSMLHQDAQLGLSFHDEPQSETPEDQGYRYLHEQIDDLFQLKAADLNHTESVTSAFRKVHGYKYINDWSFLPALEREMVNRGVPVAERTKAMEFIPRIISELRSEQKEWSERNSGFNPRLTEVRKVSQPKQPTDFTIEKRPLNTKNVQAKAGDGSPARTNMSQPPLPSDGHDAEINP